MIKSLALHTCLMVVLVVLLQGCGTAKQDFPLSDFRRAETLPYDSPIQIIYKIDESRFVTLERSRDCSHGQSFYNDTKTNVRVKIGNGLFENYQGRLINADPTRMNFVLPLASPPETVCGDRGCAVSLIYSIDGGATFESLTYMPNSFDPFKDSKKYKIIMTSDMLFVGDDDGDANGDLYVKEYPLHRHDDPNDPRARGKDLVTFMASTRPGFLSKFHTPSGQNRIKCDASIKPTNPDARLVP
ncbi:MAG: hypothetical protein V4764_09545 [Burkholderia sp.]